MEISEYENIEIFNKTQSFGINKCESQILRPSLNEVLEILKLILSEFQPAISGFY
jgi:hypothetical protein